MAGIVAGRMDVRRSRSVATEVLESNLTQSLRRDVEKHPGDFVVFETWTAANQFMRHHAGDVHVETNLRMIDSGVLGYWSGRTVVVLPIVSSMTEGLAR